MNMLQEAVEHISNPNNSWNDKTTPLKILQLKKKNATEQSSQICGYNKDRYIVWIIVAMKMIFQNL